MRLLTSNMGLRDSHCSVVYGGTSLLSVPARTKQQARAELGLNTDSKILLSIGHLGAIKGHQDTLPLAFGNTGTGIRIRCRRWRC